MKNLFSKSECELISRMPHSIIKNSNKLAWRCTVDGKFSIMSAYNLQVDLMDSTKGQSSNSTTLADLWSKLWKLKIPNAVKVFLWKASHEALPTKLNLFKRKVVDLPDCPICCLEPESAAQGNCKNALLRKSPSSNSQANCPHPYNGRT